MELSSYKFNAMAFWLDHVDDDVDGLRDSELEVMAEELDATACDAASYYFQFHEAPMLCGDDDLEQLAKLKSACAMLLAYWQNGTAVDGGSEVADRVRAALAFGSAATEGSGE